MSSLATMLLLAVKDIESAVNVINLGTRNVIQSSDPSTLDDIDQQVLAQVVNIQQTLTFYAETLRNNYDAITKPRTQPRNRFFNFNGDECTEVNEDEFTGNIEEKGFINEQEQ